MPVVHLAGSAAASRCAFVFLPGRWDSPADFIKEGFPEALLRRGVRAEMVAADARLGYYLDGTVVDRLDRDVIAPLRSAGHDRLWLVGVSMGGLGGMLVLRSRPAEIAGVVALAPYLGSPAITTEIVASGGLGRWQPAPPELVGSDQRQMWLWLKGVTEPSAPAPPIWLAFGDRDKLVRSDALLAARLPAAQVFTNHGRHDWPTWRRLWASVLAAGVFDRDCAGTPAPARPSKP
jgi:pimeloyl-ACP methyl ester carboxylesterase